MFDREARLEIERVAKDYRMEPARLLAVAWVESAGRPYWRVGRRNVPAIRPEGHYFYKRLSGAKRKRAVAEGLAAAKAGVVKVPKSYAAVYEMLDRMMAIDASAALESISMGLGQVMGAWWKDLGFKDVQEMWATCMDGIDGQVDVMMRYIVKYKLLDEIRDGRWAEFAEGYNGPAYRKNRYDTKLAKAYRDFKAGTVEVNAEKATKAKLAKLGYQAKGAEAVKQFQRDHGLVDDGDAGPMTAEVLDEAMADKRQAAAPRNAGVVTAAGTAVGAAAIKAGPDIVEAVSQGSDVANSAQGITAALGLPEIIGAVIIAIVLGAFVYWLVKRGRRPSNEVAE